MIALDQIFAMLVADCHIVAVIFDPRDVGVEVPDQFKAGKQLTLNYGWNLPTKIPDMKWDAEALTATLSFGGVPFPCRVPWKSVIAMQGDEKYLIAMSRPVRVTEIEVKPAPAGRGKLKLVD